MPYDLRFRDDDLVEVGIDETGRGALFGRMYVGAVVLPNELDCFFDNGAGLSEIKDSKKLTERKRGILYDYVKECAIDYSVVWCSNETIDQYNVLQADLMTMHKALESLTVPVQRVLVDGDCWKRWEGHDDVEVHTVIEGDSKYLAIAGAAILAKVERDNWVQSVCDEHPEWDERYSLRGNKGYGAAKHMAGLKEFGPTPLHRMSFAPCGGGAPKQATKVVSKWVGID
jgi:ribonuclease HII